MSDASPPALPPGPGSPTRVPQGLRAIRAIQQAKQTQHLIRHHTAPPTPQTPQKPFEKKDWSTRTLQRRPGDIWFFPTVVGLSTLLLIGLVLRSITPAPIKPDPLPEYADMALWAATPESKLVCTLHHSSQFPVCSKDPIDVIQPLQNLTDSAVTLDTLHAAASDPLTFEIVSDNCSHITLSPGGSCLILYRINMQNIDVPGTYTYGLSFPNIIGAGGATVEVHAG